MDTAPPPTTIIGKLSELETLIEVWGDVVRPATLSRINPPRIYGSEALALYPEAFRVATVRHAHDVGPLLVERINGEASRRGLATVFAELGYWIESV
jgi:hypothetical protein